MNDLITGWLVDTEWKTPGTVGKEDSWNSWNEMKDDTITGIKGMNQGILSGDEGGLCVK